MPQRQLTFTFSVPELHVPPDRTAHHRRDAAKTILEQTSAREIRHLIETGQVTTGAQMNALGVETYVRDQREALKKFVQLIANGGYAREASQQEAAWSLLRQFDALADLPLALELKKLGLCSSTTSFGRPLGSGGFSVLLWGLRRAMEKYEKHITPHSPPSPFR